MGTFINISSAKLERSGDVIIITLPGGKIRDVDNVLAAELEGKTEALLACHLLIDFAHVQFLSSVELGTLITLNKQMKTAGGRLTLFNLSISVFEIFTAMRLQTILGICREETAVSPV